MSRHAQASSATTSSQHSGNALAYALNLEAFSEMRSWMESVEQFGAYSASGDDQYDSIRKENRETDT